MKTTWQTAWVCLYPNHLGPAGALTTIPGFYSPSEMSFRDHVCGQLIVCVSVWLSAYALQFHFGPLAFLAFSKGPKTPVREEQLGRESSLLVGQEEPDNTTWFPEYLEAH